MSKKNNNLRQSHKLFVYPNFIQSMFVESDLGIVSC